MNTLTIYSPEDLIKIQQLEIKALKEIIRICDILHIKYFLVGGTALGAVRHNGVIPWDDDIDIGMTRENYEIFLEKAPLYISKGYYLQTPYNNKKNPYFYSKLRIDGTKFVEYCNHTINMHHGVYVDIFPFDEVPDDDDLNKKQFEKIQRFIELFKYHQSPDVSKEPKTTTEILIAFLRRILYYTCQIIPLSYIVSTLTKEMTKYNGTGQTYLTCFNFPKRNKDLFKKSTIEDLEDIQFEDIVAKIPQDWDFNLKKHYGNYMQLPPENQRFGHKPYVIEL